MPVLNASRSRACAGAARAVMMAVAAVAVTGTANLRKRLLFGHLLLSMVVEWLERGSSVDGCESCLRSDRTGGRLPVPLLV